MQATLRLNVTGERIRNLLSLRLKEFDRMIDRVVNALEVVRAEEVQASAEIESRVSQVRERAQRMVPLGRRGNIGGGHSESVGLGQYADYQAQIDQYSNALETLRYQKAQVVWMSESFVSDKAYELDTHDLMILGLGITSNFGTARGVFDPLDL